MSEFLKQLLTDLEQLKVRLELLSEREQLPIHKICSTVPPLLAIHDSKMRKTITQLAKH